ncbi:MAG TPA: cobalamin-dependent protein [Nitrospinota bacterium]|nr:cobalamin-dependent protein [Nitrospinota bacterium]|tara:strand:+ start:32867 stop:33547 length:681 start_codon:yes stop_codon:yes gene_type:complete
MDQAKKDELEKKLAEGVVEFDDDEVKEASEEWVATGEDTYDAIFDGLVTGMEEVGRLFATQEYFVPEMLMAADSLYIGLDIMRPHMVPRDTGVKGTVVIGTVQGDVHDIGKNIVKMMFDVAGFQVFDLGRDVPLEDFLKKQLETNSDIVCLSAMMTTTMMGMPKVIEMIKEKNPTCKILIGGAPITDDVADKFGADGTANDATNALEEAIKMIVALKDIQKEASKN